MKHPVASIVCLVLALCLLGGCGKDGVSVTCKDLTLTLPNDFMDLSSEGYAGDADLFYGCKTLIVKGLAEEKAGLVDMTLEQFTGYVITSNKLSCTPAPTEYGFVFTYEAAVGEKSYSYTTATFDGEENFWILQFYCPSENAAEHTAAIDTILKSIVTSN